jgi:hypothetical protein
MRNAKKYFARHPGIKLLWFTTDNLAFTDEPSAITHANTLDDPTILPITRREANAAFNEMGLDLETESNLDSCEEAEYY